jgi:hypothetical protein
LHIVRAVCSTCYHNRRPQQEQRPAIAHPSGPRGYRIHLHLLQDQTLALLATSRPLATGVIS